MAITENIYNFKSKCIFSIHSEWYGKSHAEIVDSDILLDEVFIEKAEEYNSYILVLKCNDNKKCIKISGENT